MKFSYLLFLFFLLIGCGENDETPEFIKNCKNNVGSIDRKDDTFYNIVVLLDLSNRIATERQSNKDLEIINTILNIFQNAQKKFGYQFSKDKLSIKICKQKNDDVELNINIEDLVVDMDRDNSRNMNFPNFCKQKESFETSINSLYDYAIQNKSFYGADIWNFFNEEMLSLLKENDGETKYKNKVIILTDGYLNFASAIEKTRPKGTFMRGYYRMRNNADWKKIFEDRNYKLTPHPHDYFDTDVIVLEVDPKKPTEYTNEFNLLSNYWKTWFEDMELNSEVYSKSKPIKDLIPLLKKDLFN